VDGFYVDGFLYPTGRICRHNEGDNKSVLKVKVRSYKRPGWPGGRQKLRENSFCFQVLLKPSLTCGRGKI
jgi:hypothetical protein